MPEGGPRYERKETPKEILIVEVGSGSLPLFADVAREYREQFDANPDARYVGVDLDEAELRHGKDLQRSIDEADGRGVSEKIHYVAARADALPFKDGSVSELVLRNVLGDPDIPVEEKHAALTEAARVMRKDAVLKIIEVYTPLMVYEDDLYAYIDAMEGTPFVLVSKEELEALPPHEKAADHSLSRDEAAGITMFGGLGFTLRYRRT